MNHINTGSAATVPLPWYGPEDFEEAKGLMLDAVLMPASYAQWLVNMLAYERQLDGQGLAVTRVYVETHTFLAWCHHSGRRPDAHSQGEYVREYLKSS